MTASVGLLQTALRILEEAGRPLSVRRILRAGQQEKVFGADGPDLDALRAALAEGVDDGAVVEARRGVFTLGGPKKPPTPAEAVEDAAPAEAAPAEAAPAPEAGDDSEPPKRRRRRRRRTKSDAATPAAPVTLEETAELSAGATDRDALKGKMWTRLRDRASQVTDRPSADAPQVEPASDTPAAQAEPAVEKPRRRRRRRSAPDDAPAVAEAAPATPASAPEAKSEPADPRARLKARLAGRRTPAEAAPASVEPAAVPKTPVETTRSTRPGLKARLAARARGAKVEPPAAPKAAPAEASAPKATPKTPRAALKARLAARAGAEVPAKAAPTANAATVAPEKPKADRGAADPRARLKSRLSARRGAEAPAAAPAAPSTPAPAAPSTPAPTAPKRGKNDPRAALKARLAARGTGRKTAPAESSAPAAPAPVEKSTRGDDPRAAMKARLAARRGAPTPAPAEVVKAPLPEAAAPSGAAANPRSSANPRSAMKARLAARRGASSPAEKQAPATPVAQPLDVPLAPTRRPYKERRKAEKATESERRDAQLPEISPTSALVDAALNALRDHGKPMKIGDLAKRVDAVAGGGSHGLRAALLAENAHCDRAGLRAPFVRHYAGTVGLTEWGLSSRYQALEGQMQKALAEQRELVRRDLLARVGGLDEAGFEQVVVMLLERLGHHGAKVVHRKSGTVALTARRADHNGAEETVAVIARKSWSPIKVGTVRRLRDMLGAFGAGAGLLLSVGTFATSARGEAAKDGLSPVRLIDGAGLAALLHDHGIGLASHQPTIRYVDVAFFESLEG